MTVQQMFENVYKVIVELKFGGNGGTSQSVLSPSTKQ